MVVGSGHHPDVDGGDDLGIEQQAESQEAKPENGEGGALAARQCGAI